MPQSEWPKTYPRPYPGGGWYCEHGAGLEQRGKGSACQHRATWVLKGCADNPGRRPGSVVCDVHFDWFDRRVEHVRVRDAAE
jgi:hypothetical protein